MSSTEEAHNLVMRGNGESENRAMATYRKAGEMGCVVGYFNAGNCLIFGTMGVEQDKKKGLKMWEKGTELAKKSGTMVLEMWAEESNEKVACKDVLNLESSLEYVCCMRQESGDRETR